MTCDDAKDAKPSVYLLLAQYASEPELLPPQRGAARYQFASLVRRGWIAVARTSFSIRRKEIRWWTATGTGRRALAAWRLRNEETAP